MFILLKLSSRSCFEVTDEWVWKRPAKVINMPHANMRDLIKQGVLFRVSYPWGLFLYRAFWQLIEKRNLQFRVPQSFTSLSIVIHFSKYSSVPKTLMVNASNLCTTRTVSFKRPRCVQYCARHVGEFELTKTRDLQG